VEHAAARLRELKAERAALGALLTQATPNVEELREPLEAAVRDLLTASTARTDQARDVLRKELAGKSAEGPPRPGVGLRGRGDVAGDGIGGPERRPRAPTVR
jgi:hypothetical protein